MNYQACYPLAEGEILNASHPEYPLFAVTIHGSDRERIKLSKRLVCAVKHLPMRLTIRYEKDTLRSLEAGVRKDPTLMLDDEIVAEGLVPAETLTRRFERRLAQKDSAR